MSSLYVFGAWVASTAPSAAGLARASGVGGAGAKVCGCVIFAGGDGRARNRRRRARQTATRAARRRGARASTRATTRQDVGSHVGFSDGRRVAARRGAGLGGRPSSRAKREPPWGDKSVICASGVRSGSRRSVAAPSLPPPAARRRRARVATRAATRQDADSPRRVFGDALSVCLLRKL